MSFLTKKQYLSPDFSIEDKLLGLIISIKNTCYLSLTYDQIGRSEVDFENKRRLGLDVLNDMMDDYNKLFEEYRKLYPDNYLEKIGILKWQASDYYFCKYMR